MNSLMKSLSNKFLSILHIIFSSKIKQSVSKREESWPKTKEEFDSFWKDKEAMKNYYEPSRISFFYEVLGAVPQRIHKVLDIGCGDGFLLSLIYSNRKIKEKSLFGVDYSVSAINVAKKRLPEGNFLNLDVRDLSFTDRSFDLILIIETLEHIKEWRITLDLAWKMLVNGGTLIITVPDGEKDKWKGHTNFWSYKQFRKNLLKYAEPTIRIIDEGRVFLAVLKK